jgi:spermidine/putrescine-binding protein
MHMRSKKVSRRSFLAGSAGIAALAGTGGLSGILSGCGGDDETVGPGESPAASADLQEISLSMIGWAGAEDPVWTDAVANELKASIQYKGATSMPELIQLVRSAPAGTYDLAGPYNMEATPTLIEAGLLEPLNKSDYPINDMVEWDRPSEKGSQVVDGTLYYIRAQTDHEGMVFNTNHISVDEVLDKGYDVLYEDKYRGKVIIWDNPTPSISMAAVTAGFDNPFDLTNDEWSEVRDKLLALKKQVILLPAFGEAIQAMAAESGWLIATYLGSAGAAVLVQQGLPIQVFYDKRGVLTSSEGFSLLKSSKNLERAREVTKFLLTPEGLSKLAQHKAWLSVPSLPAAWDILPPSLREVAFVDLDADSGRYVPKLGDPDMKLIEWVRPTNPPFEDWLKLWNEFKEA